MLSFCIFVSELWYLKHCHLEYCERVCWKFFMILTSVYLDSLDSLDSLGGGHLFDIPFL